MSVVVTEFRRMLAELADALERAVLAIWARVKSALLDRDEATALIVVAINHANASATGLADAAVAAQIETLSGTPVLPVAVLPVDDSERLVKAVRTITGSDADTAMQLPRLARAEPLSAAQDATTTALARHDVVRGWVRQLNPDACELCCWWYRGGHVWPPEVAFQRHPGCNCAARVVLTDKENRNG